MTSHDQYYLCVCFLSLMAFDVTHLKFLLTPGRKEIKFLCQTLTSNISKKNYHCCTLWKVSRNVLIFSLIDATTEIHKFFPCQCHHRNVFIFPLHQNVPATLLGPSVTMDVTRTQAFADASVMLLAETATNAM